jgi:hypothetical protein
MIELQRFDNLVNKISRSFPGNSVYTEEDIKQELWVKLIKILPAAEKTIVNEYEFFKFIKASLNNRLIDIKRHQSRRPDTSFYSKSAIEHDVEIRTVNKNKTSPVYKQGDSEQTKKPKKIQPDEDGELLYGNFLSQTEYVLLKEMTGIILKWAEFKDPEIKLFLQQAIDPSDEVWAEWERKKLGYPRYRSFEYIPPFTLCSILGIPKNKVYYILDEIRQFVNISKFVQ